MANLAAFHIRRRHSPTGRVMERSATPLCARGTARMQIVARAHESDVAAPLCHRTP